MCRPLTAALNAGQRCGVRARVPTGRLETMGPVERCDLTGGDVLLRRIGAAGNALRMIARVDRDPDLALGGKDGGGEAPWLDVALGGVLHHVVFEAPARERDPPLWQRHLVGRVAMHVGRFLRLLYPWLPGNEHGRHSAPVAGAAGAAVVSMSMLSGPTGTVLGGKGGGCARQGRAQEAGHLIAERRDVALELGNACL